MPCWTVMFNSPTPELRSKTFHKSVWAVGDNGAYLLFKLATVRCQRVPPESHVLAPASELSVDRPDITPRPQGKANVDTVHVVHEIASKAQSVCLPPTRTRHPTFAVRGQMPAD